MKALLFDLDGTLVNTLGDIRAALNHCMELTYNRSISDAECRKVVGRGLKNALKGALWYSGSAYPEDEMDMLYSELISYYEEHAVDYSKPYDGVKDLLETALAKGYLLGVLSNKSDELVIQIVSKLFPSIPFSYVHGQRKDKPLKPAKEAIDDFLSVTGLKAEEVLYIGDSEVDAEFVNNVPSLEGIIVTYGFRSKEELSGCRDVMLIDSIKQIEERL